MCMSRGPYREISHEPTLTGAESRKKIVTSIFDTFNIQHCNIICLTENKQNLGAEDE